MKNGLILPSLSALLIAVIISCGHEAPQKKILKPSFSTYKSDSTGSITTHTSNAKASINLGIYGVDFGYIKMFGIGQKMINYIQTVLEMSNKLGIPDRFLIGPIRRMESDMESPDTIMKLVNKSYKDIEDHLRKDGRESTAGLMADMLRRFTSLRNCCTIHRIQTSR